MANLRPSGSRRLRPSRGVLEAVIERTLRFARGCVAMEAAWNLFALFDSDSSENNTCLVFSLAVSCF